MDAWLNQSKKQKNDENNSGSDLMPSGSLYPQLTSMTNASNEENRLDSQPSSNIPNQIEAPVDKNDIGIHIKEKCSDEVKYDVLKNRWLPDGKYKFPASTNRNLRFQRKWMIDFPWLAYSATYDGAFCRFCCFFCPREVGKGRHTITKTFVTEAFNNWKKAIDAFRNHQEHGYHRDSCVSAQNFIDVYDKKIVDISLQLDKAKKVENVLNRKMLTSIVETIILIGRQDIACRGHRDSGEITPEIPVENDGNFRALLRFRMASGDENFKNHMQTSKLRYISPQIQNELIEICGYIIVKQIVANVNRSGCFSMLADETTDISGIEQFSLCVRYVHEVDGISVLREDFLKFVPVHETTGEALMNTIIDTCNKIGIDLKFLKGQGYDGASNMSGRFQGCATRIREKYPQALYLHCANHSLNLAIGDACDISVVRNCLGSIKEIINFFRSSAKRQTALLNIVENLDCEIKKKRLTRYCETRWVERLDAIIKFKEMFVPIFITLEKIEESWIGESAQKAATFKEMSKSSNFIISMLVIEELFAYAHPLSVSLQGKQVDLSAAMEMVNILLTLLKKMRENAELEFHKLFNVAGNIAEEIGSEIKVPRLAKHQTHRENYENSCAEEYYRRSIFIPFVDHFIHYLESRFTAHKNLLCTIQNFLPSKIIELEESELNESIDIIVEQWPDISQDSDCILKKETLLWKQKWIGQNETPKTFMDALNRCCGNMFPSIFNILKTSATLPVSIAAPERSFSALKRIKTYLRNSMKENRLNGLASLSIQREMSVDPEDVINKFIEKDRRINFN